jgi:hypothetical protein
MWIKRSRYDTLIRDSEVYSSRIVQLEQQAQLLLPERTFRVVMPGLPTEKVKAMRYEYRDGMFKFFNGSTAVASFRPEAVSGIIAENK